MKAIGVTRIVELHTFNIQLTGLWSALKFHLTGNLQSSWGRIHR